MNRRGLFNACFGSLFGAYATQNSLTQLQPSIGVLRQGHSITMNSDSIQQIVKSTLSNLNARIHHSLPDGSQAIFTVSELISPDNLDTIWNAPSTG